MTKSLYSLIVAVALIIPTTADARHNSWQRIDTGDLDDDAVDEIPVPVLFGVELDRVIPDFGDPRGGGTREHEGQDFRAPLGTPIVSPTEAIVTSIGEGSSAGIYVYTVNPGGERFRYMHLDAVADDLERGDELEVGDFIGTVGDTGNAPEGVYHLHFETRDDDNDAQDPYERLVEGFDLEDKMSFLNGILRGVDDRDEYAEFLVSTFSDDFEAALQEGIDLPRDIEDALEDTGVVDDIEKAEQLQTVLAVIPQLLQQELQNGDTGAAVTLLQLYLLYTTDGAARDRLAAAGPTGYYGSITAGAVLAYQAENDVAETGVYDSATRRAMLD